MASVFGDGEVCPFGDKELADIMMDSGCLPGPALRQAERMLSSTTRTASTPVAGGFPMRNILAIAGVVTAIAMIFIYQWGASSATGELPQGELSPELQAQLEAAKDFNYPSSADGSGLQAASEASSTVELADRAVVEAGSALSAADLSIKGSAKVAPSDAAIKRDKLTAESASASVSAASDSGAQTDIAVTEAQAASKEDSAETVQVNTPSYTPDEQALLAPESGYIVQLLGSHSSSGAESFRDQWRSQVTGSLYRYQTTYKGKDWFVVVSGVYSSRAEAKAAVNAMPAQLRKQSPWVRPVGDVQKVIR